MNYELPVTSYELRMSNRIHMHVFIHYECILKLESEAPRGLKLAARWCLRTHYSAFLIQHSTFAIRHFAYGALGTHFR